MVASIAYVYPAYQNGCIKEAIKGFDLLSKLHYKTSASASAMGILPE